MRARNAVLGGVVAVAVLFVIALVVGALVWSGASYGMGPGMMGGFRQPYGMHRFGGGILMVVIGVVVLGGLAWLVSAVTRNGRTPVHTNEVPLEILRRRYASGEIDREEFERIKESLVS